MIKTWIPAVLCFVAFALPMSGEQKNAGNNNAPANSETEVSEEDMTYASISKTNPFEIVPAAGMELLGSVCSGDNSEMVNDMLTFAKKFLGTRYVRGGKSPKGFDCSGFTSYVFNQFGVSLGASSSAQFTQGFEIGREEIMAGDLLFFTGRNSRSGRVGHVGITIDNNLDTGEITFIHAAIGGGIRIDRISAPYYSARYMGARRIF